MDSSATVFDTDEGSLMLRSALITHSVCGYWSPGRSSPRTAKLPQINLTLPRPKFKTEGVGWSLELGFQELLFPLCFKFYKERLNKYVNFQVTNG